MICITKSRFCVVLILFVLLLPLVSADNTGVVLGIVVDSLNNLVDGASIKGYCANIVVSDVTDKFGTFVSTKLPEGYCTFYARFNDAVGFTNVAVEKGQTKEMRIMLDKTIVSQSKKWHYTIGLVAITLLILAALFLFLRTRKKSVPTKNSQLKNERMKSLLKGLSDREQQIVKCLIAKKGQSTQSRIHYETKMPKASLSRHIKILEAKKIIEVQRIGKLCKIKLNKAA